MVRSLGPDLPEQLLSNDSFEPLGYKLKGYSGMAEVEHLGDFVSMLESAWEPSNSLVLARL